ncbi:MAG: hypothetical protein MZV64_42775 [Ignavibacteriales bacterium]|nr:hypothetical protein [Ignavibacteriales bacterium]
MPDRQGEAYTKADAAGILGTLVLLAVFPAVLALADDAALRHLRRARHGRARGGHARRVQGLRELPLPGQRVVPGEGAHPRSAEGRARRLPDARDDARAHARGVVGVLQAVHGAGPHPRAPPGRAGPQPRAPMRSRPRATPGSGES